MAEGEYRQNQDMAEPDEITMLLRRLEIHLRKGEHAFAVNLLARAAFDVPPVTHRDPRLTSDSPGQARARHRAAAGRETATRREGRSA